MSRKYLIGCMVLMMLLSVVEAMAQTGYRRDPWGGRVWTGPGAPPHWSPGGQRRYDMMKQRPNLQPQKPHYGYGKPNHPAYFPSYPHHPKYHKHHKYYQSHMRGSQTYIYVGAGGYYISSTGIWGWHDKRRQGFVYYSRPVYDTQYIIIEIEAPVERREEKKNEPDYGGFTPFTSNGGKCGGGPEITRDADGALYMYTRKPSSCD